jgi:hypothetical protein
VHDTLCICQYLTIFHFNDAKLLLCRRSHGTIEPAAAAAIISMLCTSTIIIIDGRAVYLQVSHAIYILIASIVDYRAGDDDNRMN